MRALLVLALVGCGREVAPTPAPEPICAPTDAAVEEADDAADDAASFDELMLYLHVELHVLRGSVAQALRPLKRLFNRLAFGPIVAPWPRLGDRGFTGLTPAQMASTAVLQQRFGGVYVQEGVTARALEDVDGVDIARLHVTDGRVHAVTVYAPGVETTDGLQVGVPLSAVLKLGRRHRCERTGATYASGLKTSVAIRCWVGAGERLRYVAQLEPPGMSLYSPYFGERIFIPSSVSLAGFADGAEEDGPPMGGRALDRWIAESDLTITMILWEQTSG